MILTVYYSHVIPTLILILILTSSFAFNQTSNIFYLKILYALFSAFDFLYINLDITSYISVLALSGKKVLYVL